MLLAKHMKTLSNTQIVDKQCLLQKKNSLQSSDTLVTETTKQPINLNQVHIKFIEFATAYAKPLKVLAVLFFFIIGTIIFIPLLARALDIESEAQEHVMLDYKDDLNKKAPYDAPQDEKE